MYKLLLDKKLVLGDMESVDTEFYNSVKYILENDPEPLCLTFTANREFLGRVMTQCVVLITQSVWNNIISMYGCVDRVQLCNCVHMMCLEINFKNKP